MSNIKNNGTTFTMMRPAAVLVLTADGKLMRGERQIEELDRDELLVLVRELVDVIRR